MNLDYNKLNLISENGHWDDWIDFFLNAIIIQAIRNSKKAKSILELYDTKKKKITNITHSQFVINIIDTLFTTPIFNTSDFVKISKIPRASALRYLKLLCQENVLTELEKGKGRRPGIMVFNKLVDIVKY